MIQKQNYTSMQKTCIFASVLQQVVFLFLYVTLEMNQQIKNLRPLMTSTSCITLQWVWVFSNTVAMRIVEQMEHFVVGHFYFTLNQVSSDSPERV